MVIRSLSTPLVKQSTIMVSRISSDVVIFHSFLEQKCAIWSLCVVCIICSALILYMYTTGGLLYIAYMAHIRNTGWPTIDDDGHFVKEGDKIVYTEKEKSALAVFTFVIICSVIEIVLAAAIMKICETTTKTPQASPSCAAYYQVLSFYNICVASFHLNFQGSLIDFNFLFSRCLH